MGVGRCLPDEAGDECVVGNDISSQGILGEREVHSRDDVCCREPYS